jgi:hypothetical protein
MGVLAVKRDWGRSPKATDSLGRYRCSICKAWKEPSAYSKNKSQKSGLNYACKACMTPRTRKYNLPTKYGISAEKFDEMMMAQFGACACCGVALVIGGSSAERPCVDHNHNTGQVRDLLCGRCNLAAGNVLDSSARADKLAAYLKKWNC